MTAGCQHVALLLSTYANGDGTSIRPTVETLAAVSGKGQSTIKESLKYLRDHGWVHQVSRGQTGRASAYRLTIPPKVQ
ncbi:helix-turn-helix domain-containing protein [Blastococcus sp. SYSU DS0973]